jgi:hypothetical protein
MIPIHRDYTAEIKKLKYESEKGNRFPSTAIVRFHVGKKEVPVIELMGHLQEEEIYQMIDRGEPVNLDECYVEKFSLKDYRLTRNLDPRENVVLKGFTARNALFEGRSTLDFSFAVIEGNEFSLENAWISREGMNFESARFLAKHTVFKGVRIPEGSLNFKNVKLLGEEVTFKHCRFGPGEKDFQYMELESANLEFIDTDFSDGNVNFVNTKFGTGNVSFKVARFGTGKVDFHFASFKGGNISFERTEFGNGRVDFRTVEFGTGRVNFNRSVFGDGEVAFDEAEMESGKFNFKRARFGEGIISFEDVMFEHVDANFEHTDFGEGTLDFFRSWFHDLSLAFCHLNGYVDLRIKKGRHVDLSDTVVRDIIDMYPHQFNSEIESLSLMGMRLIGRIYLDWERSNVRQMIYGQSDTSYRLRAEQFRILKENYQIQGSYSDEDRAYVEFKRNESRAELAEALENSPVSGLWQYPGYWFKLALFDQAGLYATSPVRVFLTMLITYLIFSVIYILLMVFTDADIVSAVSDHLATVPRAFYHSAITFLTIGYGDHYPSGSIRWVSSLEGFMGLFHMSYFTVAFVRKILR